MGRATIVSGGEDGRYVIKMDYGKAARDARVTKIDIVLLQLGLRKTWQQELVAAYQGGLDSFHAEFNALIESYVDAMRLVPPNQPLSDGLRMALDAMTAQIVKQQLWLGEAENALGLTASEEVVANIDKARLLALEITEERPSWCADYTEDAVGQVATIDVPGESGLILIAPQGRAPIDSDGVLMSREIQTPGQVFWNSAVLPGWQKFKPTYRIGTIAMLDSTTDTATVVLAPATSSAQALGVNQSDVLRGVPVVYMECHASVFAVGDRVVVGFSGQDWAAPRVIGFVDHPRACGGPSLYCIPADGPNIYGWSPPTATPDGALINDGKGSAAYYGIPGDPNPVVVDGTNRTAGVTSPFLKTGLGLHSRVARGVRADVAGLPPHGPTNGGNSQDDHNYSSMSRSMLEWASKENDYVVTYFDNVMVNGKDKGAPASGTPVKAFIPKKHEDSPSVIFAVSIAPGGGSLQFSTRPLAGASTVAWTLLLVLVLGDVASTPSLGVHNLNKVLVHPDATEFAIWFSDGMHGIGHMVVNPYTGGNSFTPAANFYSRDPASDYDPVSGSYVYFFKTKFSLDYVSGVLEYATVKGVRTHVLEVVEGAPYPPGHHYAGHPTFESTEAGITEIITADFWGVELELSYYSWHSYGVVSYVYDGAGLVEPYDYTQSASLTSRQVYYYGGEGDPILYTTKDYPSTVTKTTSYLDSFLAGRCGPSDVACFESAGFNKTERIPAMQVKNCVLHNGETVEMSVKNTPEYVAHWGAQPDDYDLPDLSGGSQSSWNATWLDGEWGRTYWYPIAPPVTMAAMMNVFRTLIPPGTAETFQNTGGGYHTTTYFLEGSVNLRHLNGFAIFSNPSVSYPFEVFKTAPSVETPENIIRFRHPPTLDINASHDYSLWHTYCSDPDALSRYALTLSLSPAASGRLKHLHIKSAT